MKSVSGTEAATSIYQSLDTTKWFGFPVVICKSKKDVEKKLETTVVGKYTKVNIVRTVTAAASWVPFSVNPCILSLSFRIS